MIQQEKPRIRVVAGAPREERHIIVIPPKAPSIPDETVGRIAIDFYQHWFSSPGRNTQQGFKDWWSINKANYNI